MAFTITHDNGSVGGDGRAARSISLQKYANYRFVYCLGWSTDGGAGSLTHGMAANERIETHDERGIAANTRYLMAI